MKPAKDKNEELLEKSEANDLIEEGTFNYTLYRYMKFHKIRYKELMQLIAYRCRNIKKIPLLDENGEPKTNKNGKPITTTAVFYDGVCFESSERMALELAEKDVANIRKGKLYLEKNGYIIGAGFWKAQHKAIKRYTISPNIQDILTCGKSTTSYQQNDALTCGKSTTSYNLTCGKSTTSYTSTCGKSATHKLESIKLEQYQQHQQQKHDDDVDDDFRNFEALKEYYDNQPYRFNYEGNTIEGLYQELQANGWTNRNGKPYKSLEEVFRYRLSKHIPKTQNNIDNLEPQPQQEQKQYIIVDGQTIELQ